MAMAMAGAAISMTSGSAKATATMRCKVNGKSFALGDDSNTIGNSVQADIDHSEVRSILLASAAATGSRSGAKNATTTSRRSCCVGQSMSASVVRSGRTAKQTKMIGAAAYAAEPTR